MMSQSPDVSSFPLLLIHEIPLHSTTTLKDAAKELPMIIDEEGTLSTFVNKLSKEINRELSDRKAKERINMLLFRTMGEQASSEINDIYKNSQAGTGRPDLASASSSSSTATTASMTVSSSSSSSGSLPPRKSSFRVPLPSELRQKESAALRVSRASGEVRPSLPLGGPAVPNAPSGSRSSAIPAPGSPVSSAPLSARSSATSSPTKAKGRRKSQYSQEALDSRKQSNYDFGSTYVVGDGGGGLKARARKAKAAMKKRKEQSTEKAQLMRVLNMKKERRKLALERLNERRKRRDEMEERQKRKEKAKMEKRRRKEEAERKANEAEEEAKVAAQKAESKAIEEGKSKLEVIKAAAEAATEVVGKVEDQESDSGESLSDGNSDDEMDKEEDDEFMGIEQVAEQEEEEEEEERVMEEKEEKVTTVSQSSSTTTIVKKGVAQPPIKRSGPIGFYASPASKDIVVKKTVVEKKVKIEKRVGNVIVGEEVRVVELEVREEEDPNERRKSKALVVRVNRIVKLAKEKEREGDVEGAIRDWRRVMKVDETNIRGKEKLKELLNYVEGRREKWQVRIEVGEEEDELKKEGNGGEEENEAAGALTLMEGGGGSRWRASIEGGLGDLVEGVDSSVREEGGVKEGGVFEKKQEEGQEKEEEDKEDEKGEEEREGKDKDQARPEVQAEVHPEVQAVPQEQESENEDDHRMELKEVTIPVKNENETRVETKEILRKLPVIPRALKKSELPSDMIPMDVKPKVETESPQQNRVGAAARARINRLVRVAENLEAEGNLVGAAEEWGKVLKLNPDHDIARERLGAAGNSDEGPSKCDETAAEEKIESAVPQQSQPTSTAEAGGAGDSDLDSSTESVAHVGVEDVANEEETPTSPTPHLKLPTSPTKPLDIKNVAEVAESFSARRARIEAAKERVERGWTPRKELIDKLDGEELGGKDLIPKPPTGREGKRNPPKAPKTMTSATTSTTTTMTTTAQNAEGEERMFSDIYPHFSSIFSAFHERDSLSSQNRSNVGPSTSGGSRRGKLGASELAASMHWQWWLYSVFNQVRDDYSTVFETNENANSGNKGHMNNGESDDDDDDDNDDDDAMDWTPNVNQKQSGQKAFYAGGSDNLLYRVNSSRAEVYNIVSDVLTNTKPWLELPTGLGLKTSWNLLWSWSKPKVDFTILLVWQKVNHFRNARALTRKDLLKKHIQRFCASVGGIEANSKNNYVAPKQTASNEVWNLMPQTFVLPQEFNSFVKAFTKGQAEFGEENLWIIKPVGMSRGRGISVVNDIGSVSYSEQVVCQKYLRNPLLLNGYKFDLRIYVLVTSFSPLEAFVFREGFARLSSQKFSIGKGSIANKWVHLTNSSIQKNAKDTMPADNPCKTSGENGGSKISLTYLWKALAEQGVETTDLWGRVCDLCLKTLMVAEDSIPSQPNAFEVFGFDVIFDDNLSAWLIEVNASPAMARESRLDEKIKEAMIHDTIKIVNPPKFDRKELVAVCERRMKDIQMKSSHRSKDEGVFKTEKEQLEDDLRRILRGVHPRRYGEFPKDMGSYQRLAPGERSYDVLKKARSRLFVKPM